MPTKAINMVNAPSHIARSRQWENDMISLNPLHEVAALYDKRGKLVAARRGESHDVGFSEGELSAARGGTLTHFHPSGHSFSHDDLALSHEKGLTVRAFGKDKEDNLHFYQIKAKNPSSAIATKITKEFPHQENQARNDLLNSKQGLSDEELLRGSREAAVKRTAKENGLSYTHTVKPGGGVREAIEGYRKSVGYFRSKETKVTAKPIVEYSPDQVRDAQGRFTSGDSGFSPLTKDSAHDTARGVHHEIARGQGNKVTGYARAAGVDRYEKMGRRINTSLRNDAPLSHEDTAAVSIMDNLTKNSTIPHDLAIYRGVENNVSDNFANMKVGDTFREKGFTSGQVSSKDANDFRGAKGEGGFVKIEVEKGAKGFADAQNLSTVTLPRGSRFVLMSKSSAAVPSSASGPARMIPVYTLRLM